MAGIPGHLIYIMVWWCYKEKLSIASLNSGGQTAISLWDEILVVSPMEIRINPSFETVQRQIVEDISATQR